MDGWLVFWKIKIAVMAAPVIAVKIMGVLHNGFILRHLLLQYRKPQFFSARNIHH
ncbi:hypothetical protein [Nostoc sp. TCL240-02]|uniref:hypothetical protein n=1 Tax=Nostoc sp. TCL240-02 TaxID=2572090 RepID=UPI00157FB8C7|nr:hypothetical protein [Nostoc sp. TCL240-02]